jgi:hypothetical protein
MQDAYSPAPTPDLSTIYNFFDENEKEFILKEDSRKGGMEEYEGGGGEEGVEGKGKVESSKEVQEVRWGLSPIKKDYYKGKVENKVAVYTCNICQFEIKGKVHLTKFYEHLHDRHWETFRSLGEKYFENIAREAANYCWRNLPEERKHLVMRRRKEEIVGEEGEGKRERKGEDMKEGKEGKKDVKKRKKGSKKGKAAAGWGERVKVFRKEIGEEAVKRLMERGLEMIKVSKEGGQVSGGYIDAAYQILLSDGDLNEADLQTIQ